MKSQKRYEEEKIFPMTTYVYLVAGHLFIFLRMKGPNLIVKLNSVSFSVMHMKNLVTDYGISLIRRLSEAEM